MEKNSNVEQEIEVLTDEVLEEVVGGLNIGPIVLPPVIVPIIPPRVIVPISWAA